MINQDILRVCKLIQTISPYNLMAVMQTNLVQNRTISSTVFNFYQGPYIPNPLSVVITKILFIKFAHQHHLIQRIKDNVNLHLQKYAELQPMSLSSYERYLFEHLNNDNWNINAKQIINSYFNDFAPHHLGCDIDILYNLFYWNMAMEDESFWLHQTYAFNKVLRTTTWKDIAKIITKNYTLIKQYD